MTIVSQDKMVIEIAIRLLVVYDLAQVGYTLSLETITVVAFKSNKALRVMSTSRIVLSP